MNISLESDSIVITGGAVRLGRAIALACARAGANVAITYHHSADQARQTLDELRAIGSQGARFAMVRVDLTQKGASEYVRDEAQKAIGEATALVNNAAIFRRTPFAGMSEDDFDDHINANLKAPYLLCKTFGDEFLSRGGGAIINIADIYGLRPLKNYAPYCVSKAGLVMLTQTLALALAPTVRVNCICPGTILPPSQEQGEADAEAVLLKKIPLRRLGDLDEIGATAVFLLGGPAFISGAVLPVDGAQSLRP